MHNQGINISSATAACGDLVCQRPVKVESGHAFCNTHRPCNLGGKFAPEICDVCRSLFGQAKSGSPLAPVSKA